MPIPAFSTRFIKATGVVTAPYSVATGFVVVVRQITVAGGGPNVTCELVYGTSGSPLETAVRIETDATTWAQWQGRVVVNAGESFFMTSSSSSAMTAHGYLLSA